jgi:integrase
VKEKAPTLAGDSLAAERRRMPWLAVEKEYEFAGRRQLIVQRAFLEPGLMAAHPHMLHHALASAMAANRRPASIIAAQLRHADGGTLARRVYIHQLPHAAPRLAGLIEDLYGPAAGTHGQRRHFVRRRESGGKSRLPSDQR